MRIYGEDGILLTGGVAALEIDPEMGNWKGLVQTLNGTAVAGKALVTFLPQGVVGDRATSKVTGLGDQPF